MKRIAQILLAALTAGHAFASSDVPVPMAGSHILMELFKDQIESFFARPREALPVKPDRSTPVGGWENFFSIDMTANQPFNVRAQLRKVGAHCYIYVQEGHQVADATVERLAREFDDKIYPTNHKYFGSEWKPGIDWDPRITLLLMDIQDGWTPGKGYVAGYFFPLDEASTRLFPFSNEREIFYLDLYPGDPTRDDYMGILAHEFQHMIHSAHDRKETRWLNEALAQIAFHVNDYGHAPQIFSFSKGTDTSLIEFDNGLDDYGSVYLWTYYCLTKFGGSTPEERAAFTTALVASQKTGMEAFDEVLASRGAPPAAEVFKDWVIANSANAPSVESGKYGYDETLRFSVQPTTLHTLGGKTGTVKGEVFPWAGDYLTFVPEILFQPLNPTQVDRISLLAREGVAELSWTINGGAVPSENMLPAGSRIEGGRAISPVVALDGGRGVVVGPFARKGIEVDSVEFSDGSRQVSVPVFSLPQLAEAVEGAGSFDIRFSAKAADIAITSLVKKSGGLEIAPVADGRFTLKSLSGVESVTFVVAGLGKEKPKAVSYSYKASGSLGESSFGVAQAARLREIEDAALDLSGDDAGMAAFAASAADLRRKAEGAMADRLVAGAGLEALSVAAGAFDVEDRLRAKAVASARSALRMARFAAMERLSEAAPDAAVTSGSDAVEAATRADDQDDSHDNVGYLLFKAGEAVHSLDHLKIDALFEGEILKLWRLLEIARGFPHLPIPDGLNIRDYDMSAVRGTMQGWADQFGVPWTGTAPVRSEPRGTQEEADVKATLRRLKLASELVEFAYDNSLQMADDLTVSVYDFVRLILHAFRTSNDIAKVFEKIPVVGKAVKYLKAVIHRKIVRVAEIVLSKLSTKLKAPYNQYGPLAVSVAAWAYCKFLGLPQDPNDPRVQGTWEFAFKLLGRYALTATPRIGFIDRGKPQIDLLAQYAAEQVHEGTLEEAYAKVWDDGSSQTDGSAREKMVVEFQSRHATFERNRQIFDITRRLVSIGQYASAIDPTNISRILTVVAGAVSTGLLAHSGYRAGSMYVKMQKEFVEPGVRLAFDPGVGAEAEADQGPRTDVASGYADAAMLRLETAFEGFEQALRAARQAAGYRADLAKRGEPTSAADEAFVAAAERLEAADLEVDRAMGATALGFSAESGDEDSGLVGAAAQESLVRADAVARVLARGLGEGPVAEDPAFDAARKASLQTLYGVLRSNFSALASREDAIEPQVVATESSIKALSGGKLEIRATVANPGAKPVAGVTVGIQSGYLFAIEGAAQFDLGTIPAGGQKEARWVIAPQEDFGEMPLASIVPDAPEAKGVAKLQMLKP